MFGDPDSASHSRSIDSRWRAIAEFPPAVFSMKIGTGRSSPSMHLRQFAYPTDGSSLAVTCPPCTTTPSAPTAAASVTDCCSSLRDGMRMRLFADATFSA